MLRKLEKPRKVREKIERKLDEIKYLKEILTKVTPVYSDMPKPTPQGDKMGDELAEMVEKEEELRELVSEYNKAVKDVLNIDLDDCQQRKIINLRYLEDKTWREIADEMGVSIRRIHQIHAKILKVSSNFI